MLCNQYQSGEIGRVVVKVILLGSVVSSSPFSEELEPVTN